METRSIGCNNSCPKITFQWLKQLFCFHQGLFLVKSDGLILCYFLGIAKYLFGFMVLFCVLDVVGLYAQNQLHLHYELLNRANDEATKATVCYRISNEYEKIGAHDSALYWLNEAAMNFALSADDKAMAGCYFDMGRIYLKKSKTTQEKFAALPNFDRAIVIFRKKKEKKELAEALFEKGQLLHELSKSDEALPHLQEALMLMGSFPTQYKNKILECYNLLSKVYAATGDMAKHKFYKNAFTSGMLLEQTDPLEAKRQKEISKEQAFQIGKLKNLQLQKELEINRLIKEEAEANRRAAELEAQNLRQKQQADQEKIKQNESIIKLQNRLNTLLGIVVLLSAIMVVFLLRETRRSAASNRLLLSQKRQTEQNSSSLLLENQKLNAGLEEYKFKSKELQITKKQLTKLNNEKDKFISHLENELLNQIPGLVSTLQKALTLRENLSPNQSEAIEKLYRSLRRYTKAKERGARFE